MTGPGIQPVDRLRSLLFAPAVRPDLLAKLVTTGADGVVIDCEDATPANAKDEGRATARRLAPSLVGEGPAVFVRVNAVPSPWFDDDIGTALSEGLAGVVLPKVETLDHLDTVADALAAVGYGGLGVVAGLETGMGVADARVLLSHPVVVAGYFGAEDYIADLGGVRTPGNVEVLYARSHVALAGRLAGVPTLDQIVADFRNDAAFTQEASEARSMGFRGKLCIHPGQVALANQAFVPSAAEVDRARRLLAAYEESTAVGVAAIDFEGQMVDEPLAAQARQILAGAEEDGAPPGP